ncbi:MAG: 3-hydroxyacyl-[acyl-carrier-protein] dehydratase [Gaiellaceae bacterium]|jgi:3-hydroxyacyl-[acyl-carrier-protein] dehydratase|nr:3-hydroxyacyl-[acyl-carrier-protein] dehydratase [Gaiellaceae bacterium]
MRFLLIDSILELETGARAVGVKNITMSEDFLADHFPDRPIMPGVLILESLVQLADWVVRDASDFDKIGVATGFDRIKFRRVARPGDQLRLEVELSASNGGTHEFRGKAYSDETITASANITLAEAPLAEYLDADDARASFAILRRDVES